MLRAAGFNPTAVNESVAAIEMAYLTKPDLFIIDVMMPGMDGFQLCRKLRATPLFHETPIIVITALNDEENQKIALASGANAYLSKPFLMDELTHHINALLKTADR
jgi:two-component system alkaline phosphatase synthesis response regulator PhoP